MEKYWRSLEERDNPKEFKKTELLAELEHKKAVHTQENGTSRRDFLKAFGFTVAGSALVASCKKPVEKAIPFLIKPEEVTPGKANYYATTYYDQGEYCSVLVKVRDGRPIKIEGNDLSPISRKGTSARVQASLLNLYDDARFKSPLKNGEPVSWKVADEAVVASLNKLGSEGKMVLLITPAIISPTSRSVISSFLTAYPNITWQVYEPMPASGILKANEASFGRAVIPDYHFDKAEVIVSFAADFLGTWLSPVEYTSKYAAGRDLRNGRRMSRHYQFEAALSVTGSNADIRIPCKPSEETAILADLLQELKKLSGSPGTVSKLTSHDLTAVASDLWNKRGKGLVISGSNAPENQTIVNAINQLLENIGSTITFDRSLLALQGTAEDSAAWIAGLTKGQVAGIILMDVNPVYDHPEGGSIGEAISKLELSVSFADRNDETTKIGRAHV